MEMKENARTTTLLFSLKGFEILHQVEHRSDGTVYRHSLSEVRPANKQHTYQSFINVMR